MPQIGQNLDFHVAFYDLEGGLKSVTIASAVILDTDGSVLVADPTFSELSGQVGIYHYTLAGASNDAVGTYIARVTAMDDENTAPLVTTHDIRVEGIIQADVGAVGGNVVTSPDDFKADVSGLSTFDPAEDVVTVGANNDKAGYSLSSVGVQAIWDALTSALTTADSIGKLLVDRIDAAIGTRLASSSYVAPDNASITAIKDQTDQLSFVGTDVKATLDGEQVDANITQVVGAPVSGIEDFQGGADAPTAEVVAQAVVDQVLTGSEASNSVGGKLNAAGNAGDPWAADLSGYGVDTAGWVVNFIRSKVSLINSVVAHVFSVFNAEDESITVVRLDDYNDGNTGGAFAIPNDLEGLDLTLAQEVLFEVRAIQSNALIFSLSSDDDEIDIIAADEIEIVGLTSVHTDQPAKDYKYAAIAVMSDGRRTFRRGRFRIE